jgi:hypothetical protein
MFVGFYGQPSSSAPKWAAEGNTLAYLWEGETGGGAAGVAPDVWAARMVVAGIRTFVLQDNVVGRAAGAIPRGGITAIVPGAPDPTKGGAPVFDEPERSGVTAEAFRAYSASLRAPGHPLAGFDRAMNWQGDKVTSGPPNLKPVPGSTLVNKQPYDVWTAETEWEGIDWHVAARGYPVAHLVTAFERIHVWAPGKRLYAVVERGPQTASDTPRQLTRAEILAQNAIVIAMGAGMVIGFYTREGHPTRGTFSFDPRNDEQRQASADANAVAARFDDPGPAGTGAVVYVDAKMIKDPNTGLQVRDANAGYILKAARTIDGGLPVLIEVNCSLTRTIRSNVYDVDLPPLGVLYNGQPDLPPKAVPAPPIDPGTPDVPTVTLALLVDEVRNVRATAEQAAAEARLANARIDNIASGAGRPPLLSAAIRSISAPIVRALPGGGWEVNRTADVVFSGAFGLADGDEPFPLGSASQGESGKAA